jgi:hypothetical protein
MEVNGHSHTAANLPQERTPVPIEVEAGWASDVVWMVLSDWNAISNPSRP